MAMFIICLPQHKFGKHLCGSPTRGIDESRASSIAKRLSNGRCWQDHRDQQHCRTEREETHVPLQSGHTLLSRVRVDTMSLHRHSGFLSLARGIRTTEWNVHTLSPFW